MQRILNSLISVLLLSGCVTQKKCNNKFPLIVTISDVVHIDTVTVLRHDTIWVGYRENNFDTASPCPPQVVYHSIVKQNGLTTTVDIKNGKLTIKCAEDSLKQVIVKKDKYIRTTLTRFEVRKSEPITVYALHWWNHFYRWGFWVLLGVVGTYIIGNIYLHKR